MKFALHIISGTIKTLIGMFILFIIVAWALEFRPQDFENLEISSPQTISIPQSDTISILSWNIGYCGLGEDMDFFMDGGTQTRASHETTQQNLEAIITTLEEIDADIVLLQEVDIKSTRSYYIDQKEAITTAFSDYYSFFAYNFKTFFVPIPIEDPVGRAYAGLLTLSKFEPTDAIRMQYPVSDKWPARIFNLKRAAAICQVEISGQEVAIANTHNSAYDNGTARQEENEALSQLLYSQQYKSTKSIVGGDWNQIPPNYTLDQRAAADPYYIPIAVAADYMSSTHEWVADTSRASMRYLDKPLVGDGSDKMAITDFFLVPKDVQIISIEAIDCGFENSDHQPVLLKLVL